MNDKKNGDDVDNASDDDEESSVVQFPATNITSTRTLEQNLPKDEKEFKKNVEKLTSHYHGELANQILDVVIHQLHIIKMIPETNVSQSEITDHLRQIAFLREVILGIMCQTYHLKHPMHKIIMDNYINHQDVDEESGMIYHSYEFKKPEDE